MAQAATKVWVRRWRRARTVRRRRAAPAVVLAMLVLTTFHRQRPAVQMVGHEGLSFPVQTRRRLATSCASAQAPEDFFCVSGEPAAPPDVRDGRDAMSFVQLHDQLAERDLAFAATRASIQSVTVASLPWPPPLPCGSGVSDPVTRRSLIKSFTNRGDTRKWRAAPRCPCPSSTNATTRSRSSIGCGLPICDPHIFLQGREYITTILGILNWIASSVAAAPLSGSAQLGSGQRCRRGGDLRLGERRRHDHKQDQCADDHAGAGPRDGQGAVIRRREAVAHRRSPEFRPSR